MNSLVKKCQEPSCKSEATYGFKFAEQIYCRTHGLQNKAKTMYQVCKCGSSTPRFKHPDDEKASYCAKCKVPDAVNVSDRRCECKKHLPTYGHPTDKRPEFCSECRKEGMINLKDKHKKCVCGRVIPSYGFPTDKKPTCCVQCKRDGMQDMINTLCPCGKTAVFGFSGDAKPTYCKTCAKPQMENIVTKKCKCGKAVPVFGNPTDKKPTCCLSCKEETMINITAKQCKCGKAQPVFGLKSDTVPACCTSCKSDEMIDIRSKKCKCGKSQPVFGLKDDTVATCCSDCKSSFMTNIKARLCKCGKSQPFFGFPTDTIATCCSKCCAEGMQDIVSSKCPTRHCKGSFKLQELGLKCPYEQRGKKKYDYYCTRCFEINFPADPRTALIRDKTEEMIVRDFLAKAYTELSFIHNKPLYTGQCECPSRRRIDFRALYGNTLLCVEVDEDQHKYRDQQDEILRYDDLMMLHGGKFIFIRFNPHLYKDIEGKRKNPSMETRLNLLKQTIDTHIERIQSDQNTELLEMYTLYFNES
jgi:EsV-1-7 cysteine-rich motif